MRRDPWTPDRRRGSRRVVPFLLHARIDGTPAPVRIRQLGPGGMVVESPHPLLAGAAVTVSLGTGPKAVEPLQGQVAHCRLRLTFRPNEPAVYLVGVAFAQVTPVDAARIAAWLGDIDDHGGSEPPHHT
jgi:hypothetical protein